MQQSPQVIVIQPANPQIVYVPQYNPAVIYGTPYVVPGYTTGDVIAAGIIGFGAGIAVGAMMSIRLSAPTHRHRDAGSTTPPHTSAQGQAQAQGRRTASADSNYGPEMFADQHQVP